jgi:hypothetical protein
LQDLLEQNESFNHTVFVVGDDETLNHLFSLRESTFHNIIPVAGLLHCEINACYAVYLLLGKRILYPLAAKVSAHQIRDLEPPGKKKLSLPFHTYEEFLNSVIFAFFQFLKQLARPLDQLQNTQTYNPNFFEMLTACLHVWLPWLMLRRGVRSANWTNVTDSFKLFTPIYAAVHKIRYLSLIIRQTALYDSMTPAAQTEFRNQVFAQLTPRSEVATGADALAEDMILHIKTCLRDELTPSNLTHHQDQWDGLSHLLWIAQENGIGHNYHHHINLQHTDQLVQQLRKEFFDEKTQTLKRSSSTTPSILFNSSQTIDTLKSLLDSQKSNLVETVKNTFNTLQIPDQEQEEFVNVEKDELYWNKLQAIAQTNRENQPLKPQHHMPQKALRPSKVEPKSELVLRIKERTEHTGRKRKKLGDDYYYPNIQED